MYLLDLVDAFVVVHWSFGRHAVTIADSTFVRCSDCIIFGPMGEGRRRQVYYIMYHFLKFTLDFLK